MIAGSTGPRLTSRHVKNDATLDVVTIGHAIVDVLGYSDDEFLARHGMAKGIMELVDASRAVPLYEDMARAADGRGEHLLQISGGSAANTAVVAAKMGSQAAFIGKVRADLIRIDGKGVADGATAQ